MKYYAGIDLGGTNIVAGIVDENFVIVASAKRKTALPTPLRRHCGGYGNYCKRGGCAGRYFLARSRVCRLGMSGDDRLSKWRGGLFQQFGVLP